MKMVERMARAIADANGDAYDAIPANKHEWTRARGQFQGRFRDVNEPYQADYLDMARAAIKCLRGLPASAIDAAIREAEGE